MASGPWKDRADPLHGDKSDDLRKIIVPAMIKVADGFSRPLPTAITVVAAVGGIAFTLAMKRLPLSGAYPIWTAVGVLGTVAPKLSAA